MSNIESQSARVRTLFGEVVSDTMDKTVVVAVITTKAHPMYQKRYNVTKKYKAHDQDNTYKIGDKVTIKETRPLSKTKRWVVINKQ